MLHILKNRRDQARSNDEGFTLIELMVVVLIIAILLAIAIPTFLGAQNKAKDRSAQSSLRNGLTAGKTVYTDTGAYDPATIVADLAAVEPSLTYQAAASDGPKVISVLTTDVGFYAAALSDTGTCFYISDVAAAGGGTEFGKDESSPTCTAAIAQAPGGAFTYSSESFAAAP